jgi:hypothetical protein
VKIACLIGDYAPLRYFVNCVHRHCGVDLVVVQRLPGRPKHRAWLLRRLYWKLSERGIRRFLAELLCRPQGRCLFPQGYEDDYQRVFGDRNPTLDRQIPRLDVEDINSPEAVARISEGSFDLLLCHGTGLVKKPLIEAAKLSLNLHWGLSPYYRGSDCTEWALLNHDPYNIGVTIHRLDKSVDGGSLLGQGRPAIEPEDTAHSINMKLTKLGTDIVLKAIDLLVENKQLPFERQQRSQGYLFRCEHMPPPLRTTVHTLIQDGRLAEMLQRPSRKTPLPIVEL